jgi:uncharacterized protein (DUF305 family)
MSTYETTKPKSGRSRLEAFFNTFLESIETEIEKSNEMAEQWKAEATYWQEQAAKANIEKERQRNLLMGVLKASEPAGCQG